MPAKLQTLVLRGRPEALEAPLPDVSWADAPASLQASLDVPGGEAPLTALVTLPGSSAMVGIRVVLPDDTPPGSYRGRLQLGERKLRLQAEVGRREGVLLQPAGVSLDVDRKAGVEFALTVANTGNVAVEVPERQGVGLFALDGLDRALGRALGGKAERGLDRFDQLGAALGEEHGGMLVTRVVAGAGALAPGEVREVRVEARVPPDASTGGGYFGFWRAGGAALQVRITVRESPEVPA